MQYLTRVQSLERRRDFSRGKLSHPKLAGRNIDVRQTGTALVRSVDDTDLFFAFPPRTAVVDTFFNGRPFFERELYRSSRFRDRPFVNTGWEVVINKKDESVNADINLESLDDIRLHIYYDDFTRL